jgi:hypothetical protein
VDVITSTFEHTEHPIKCTPDQQGTDVISGLLLADLSLKNCTAPDEHVKPFHHLWRWLKIEYVQYKHIQDLSLTLHDLKRLRLEGVWAD